MNSKPNVLLLISTFRHYFIGLSLALNDKDRSYHAIFIDQLYDDDRNPLFQAAKSLTAPFAAVECMPVRGKGGSKRKVRKETFKLLQSWIKENQPVEISTGNDRRMEFQFSMHYARKVLKRNTIGSYIEDGTGTYIKVEYYSKRAYFNDRFIDTPIKKLAYGTWYSRPPVLGGSHWIDVAYLTFPELAAPPIDKIKGIHIDETIYRQESGIETIESLIHQMGCELPMEESKQGILFVLPHSSLVEKMYGSVEKFRLKVKELLNGKDNIFVKYHPRDLDDPYELKDIATLLPTAIPAEIFLCSMSFNHVIGDISTAMMSAKWLLPNCKVEYIPTQSIFTEAVSDLFSKMDIQPLHL